eukprot:m.8773 g.8773  ORF g.8773 m.8773 type:complete len:88 (+) comp7058_c0_seq1:18-281(+)
MSNDDKQNPPEEVEEEEEEEELVDIREQIKEKCEGSKKCANYLKELQTCTERVEGKNNTEETCAQELLDFLHCVDHCISHELFDHLK